MLMFNLMFNKVSKVCIIILFYNLKSPGNFIYQIST